MLLKATISRTEKLKTFMRGRFKRSGKRKYSLSDALIQMNRRIESFNTLCSQLDCNNSKWDNSFALQTAREV